MFASPIDFIKGSCVSEATIPNFIDNFLSMGFVFATGSCPHG